MTPRAGHRDARAITDGRTTVAVVGASSVGAAVSDEIVLFVTERAEAEALDLCHSLQLVGDRPHEAQRDCLVV